MFRFFLGFAAGIYTGTYYNCKPIIDRIQECIKENIPEQINHTSFNIPSALIADSTCSNVYRSPVFASIAART